MATKIIGHFGQFSTSATAEQSPDLYVPLVTVSLANDPRGEDMATGTGTTVRLLAPDLTALIDTGSQLSAIDEPIADRFNLKKMKDQDVFGVGSIKTHLVHAQLVFREISTLHVLNLSVIKMRSLGMNFDVILGWDLLRYFDVKISAKQRTVEIEYVGPVAP